MKSPVKKSASPSPLETCLGVGVLLIIALIGALIFFKQFQYDPSIFTSGTNLSGTPIPPSSENKTESFLSLKI